MENTTETPDMSQITAQLIGNEPISGDVLGAGDSICGAVPEYERGFKYVGSYADQSVLQKGLYNLRETICSGQPFIVFDYCRIHMKKSWFK